MGRGAIHVPDFINHPTRGNVVRDPETFFEATQRTDYVGNTEPIPAGVFGESKKFRIPNKGIVSELRLEFEIAAVVSAFTSCTARDKWFAGLIKRLVVTANNSAVVNVGGQDLYDLMVIQSGTADFSDLQSTSLPSGTGTTNIKFQLVVPLCTDPGTLMGAIFAESDDTYLEVDVQFESQSELMNATMTATWSGNIIPTYTSWEVPKLPYNGIPGLSAVVPDLAVIHMLNSHDTFIQATGEQRVKISQATGELMRLIWRTYDASAYSYLAPLTVYNTTQLRYGQNQVLRKNRPRDLLLQNARWFNDILPKNAQSYDLVADNSLRDVIPPDEVLDLENVVDIAASATIASGDYIHMLEQAVVRSPVWASAQPVPQAA